MPALAAQAEVVCGTDKFSKQWHNTESKANSKPTSSEVCLSATLEMNSTSQQGMQRTNGQ